MNDCSYSCCSLELVEDKRIAQLSFILKIVSDKSRLQLLCILKGGTHCVCELIKHTELSQSLISHHLKDLKKAGLVIDEKKGQWVHYSLTDKGKKIYNSLFDLHEGVICTSKS